MRRSKSSASWRRPSADAASDSFGAAPDEVDGCETDALWHRLASQALGQASYEYQSGLQQQMVEAGRRQDPLDASMLSRYALWIENQPEKALRYAQQNWAGQKTPEDARLLLAAATRAGEQAVVAGVFQWVDAHSLRDSRLEVYRQSFPRQSGDSS